MDVNTLEDLKKQAQSLNDSKSELSSEELSDKAMEIYSKLNFISCDDIEAMDRFEYFDLFISDAALAECNMDTQHLYVDKFLNKSKFGYINYNTIGSSDVASNNYKVLLNKIRPLFNIIEKID